MKRTSFFIHKHALFPCNNKWILTTYKKKHCFPFKDKIISINSRLENSRLENVWTFQFINRDIYFSYLLLSMLLTEDLEKSDFETFEDLESWCHQTTETEKQILVKTLCNIHILVQFYSMPTYTMKPGFSQKHTNTLQQLVFSSSSTSDFVVQYGFFS